jgi:hypothetical protein
VFSDRFVSLKDKAKFEKIAKQVIGKNFNKDFDKTIRDAYKWNIEQKRKKIEEDGGAPFKSLAKEDIPEDIFYLYGNFCEPGEANKIYKEIDDKAEMKNIIKNYIEDYNELSKNKIDILLFDEAL